MGLIPSNGINFRITEHCEAVNNLSKTKTEPAWMAAARTAHLSELVVGSHEGFDRQVGARGGKLSGGQKQRVAIARAIVKNPRILILDEATSALDAYSEFLVDKALKEISKDRTVLTIAHRLSTIQSADEVAVMENGVIVEKGPYPELIMKPGGFFKELINHQTFVKKKREQHHESQNN
uniref:ABC transporter domain-containing protein n=1 Tax=Heliothis virescens TaxID=7102 RepID=A0A2A4J796_HELVI